MSFPSRVSFNSGEQVFDISTNGLTRQLLQYLADLIPPGGHMMVKYDSPEQQDTAHSLALSIPPAATPLGYLLFLIGCGAGFRDWHFAEGGNEGPRKLQGYKALNNQHAQLKCEETARQLTAFLKRHPCVVNSELEKAARDRALAILKEKAREGRKKDGVKPKSKKSEKAHIHITGMTCTTCAATVEKGLAETPGVGQAKVNFASEKASTEYDPSKVSLAKIKNTISQLGYGTVTKKSIFPVSGMTCATC